VPGVTVVAVTTAFQLSSDLVDEMCAVDPVLCTYLGIPGHDDEWGETFGLAGLEKYLAVQTGYLGRFEPFLDSPELKERLAARVVMSAIESEVESHNAGDHFRSLRHMASPFHQIRLIFDAMSADTPEGRAAISRRLATVAQPLGDYRDLLISGLDQGIAVPRRQVLSVIDQARRMAQEPESIDQIVDKVVAHDSSVAPALGATADQARASFGDFADWLETTYAPRAREEDGAGREPYERAADRLVGMAVDTDEAYAWGWEEFTRLLGELERVAGEIVPGAGVEEVKEFLETDRSVTASGTAELLAFVERVLDQAVSDLSGKHFEVPEEIRPLTVQLAPAGGPLGVYYRGPSEDFSRPGGVFYSIGDQQVFPMYQHVSTAYHEGFPGHHLQTATAMLRRDQISRFQRLLVYCPGYSEGWGMYAEVLMGELGYLDNPQHYFGMLAKQMYRAARVVVDIGLHVGKDIDPGSPLFPGEPWSFERAVEFMRVYGFRTSDQARDEVLRYLGWPAQAITYKLGEREVLALRDKALAALGSSFDPKEFHRVIVDNGEMRLDILSEMVEESLRR
jgi:uncharacterized protein (DUF885 family)